MRKWGFEFAPNFHEAALAAAQNHTSVSMLALSGGGADGAFGAGLLCGWTEAGNRPSFDIVTGISTGALMAPLVFLGSARDADLKKFYTTTTGKDVYRSRGLLPAPWRDSIMSTAPLQATIERVLDDALLAEVAREHRKGRRLYVGTTNLDAGRAVIWDMGAIAASGHPGAGKLFRQVIVASASIPVAFSPMYIDVEAGGKPYAEMHVDGGVTTQVFLSGGGEMSYPGGSKPKDSGALRPRLYVIRNAKLLPAWMDTPPDLLGIAARAVSSLVRTQGIGDLFRTYFQAQTEGFEFFLATIPADFDVKRTEEFDPVFMAALFERGFDMARRGYPWQTTPPSSENLTKAPEPPGSQP